MLDDFNDPLPSDDPERSARLFAWLAQEEPPQHFDPTHAGKTSSISARMPAFFSTQRWQFSKRLYERHWFQWLSRWSLLILVLTVWCGFWVWFGVGFSGLVPRLFPEEPAPPLPELAIELVIAPPNEIIDSALETAPIPAPTSAYTIPMQDSPLTIAGKVGRVAVETYRPQPDESLFKIAAQFGLDYCTLLWANEPRRLSRRDGDWVILPIDGLLLNLDKPVTLEEIARQTGVTVEELRYSDYNPQLWLTPAETLLPIGTFILIPKGRRADCLSWTPPPWLKNDDNQSQTLRGCDYENSFRGYPTNAPLKGRFELVDNFNYRVHDGVDLVANAGTPVYAGGEGMVRYAGWHEFGYGNVVVLDHGGSFTVYAHLEAFIVTCGQPLAAKQPLGTVGKTGNANGNHLHFELRNGAFQPVDPVYIVSLGFGE